MNIFSLAKQDNKFQSELISLINNGFALSTPEVYLKNVISVLSNNKIKIFNETLDLSVGKLYVIGWGKVAGALAYAFEKVIQPDLIENGIVITNYPAYNTKKIKIHLGSHPIPSQKNITGTKKIVNLVRRCGENDYVICLVSGGGSSLLCLPTEGITLENKIETTEILLREGIQVEKINRIRKRLSAVKGGGLAHAIATNKIYNIIVSDDINDAIHSISSGATVIDTKNFVDAKEVIHKYSLQDKLPTPVIKFINDNINYNIPSHSENKEISKKQVVSKVVFNNKSLIKNLKSVFETKFENVFLYPRVMKGEFSKNLNDFTNYIYSLKKYRRFVVLAGGEIEIKRKSGGNGGRAQHFAAGMIPHISKFDNCTLAAIASDGCDYINNIGGAMVTGETYSGLNNLKIDYEGLYRNTDSFMIHKLLGTHIITNKHTQNNVFDVYIFVRDECLK